MKLFKQITNLNFVFLKKYEKSRSEKKIQSLFATLHVYLQSLRTLKDWLSFCEILYSVWLAKLSGGYLITDLLISSLLWDAWEIKIMIAYILRP